MVLFPSAPALGQLVTDQGRVWAWDADRWTYPELLGTGALRTFYIAANGNDAADGESQTTPWATVAKVNSFAKQPGDTFLFRGGDTFSGKGIEVYVSGTQQNPIVFGSYGSGRATITPGTGLLSGSNLPNPRDCGVYARNAAYITVRDLNIVGTNSQSNTSGSGVFFEASSLDLARYAGIELRNLDVSNCGRRGIHLGTSTSQLENINIVNPGFSDVVIDGCVVHDNNDGIAIWNQIWLLGVAAKALNNQHRNVTISNCICHHNHAAINLHGYDMEGTYAGNGIAIAGIDGGLVEGCIAYENGQQGSGQLGMWAWLSNAVKFRFCESHHNRTRGTDGGGFDLDGGCTNCLMEYCYSHDNDGYGFLYCAYINSALNDACTFRYCVTQNDTEALFLWNDNAARGDGPAVYHNCVAISNSGPAIVVNGGLSIPAQFYNCIFIPNGIGFIAGLNSTNHSFNGNNYVGSASFQWNGTTYSGGNALANWRAAAGNPETLAGVDTSRTWAHGLNNAGAGGTMTPAGQTPTPAMFASWLPYQLTTAAQQAAAGTTNYRTGLNLQQVFGIDPGPQDMFGNAINPATLSIGAHCP